MLEVIKIKLTLTFHVTLFDVKKKLKRTHYKPKKETFSSTVSLHSTHACCLTTSY